VTWEVVGGIATVVALGLGVYNFVTTHLATRKASLSARLESHQPPAMRAVGGELWRAVGADFTRVVVTNYGPADATDVVIELEEEVRLQTNHPGDGPIRVPVLHVGEEQHLTLFLSIDVGYPAFVDLRWRDTRRRQQQRRIWLSVREVI
jgi:hypothetical protein